MVSKVDDGEHFKFFEVQEYLNKDRSKLFDSCQIISTQDSSPTWLFWRIEKDVEQKPKTLVREPLLLVGKCIMYFWSFLKGLVRFQNVSLIS